MTACNARKTIRLTTGEEVLYGIGVLDIYTALKRTSSTEMIDEKRLRDISCIDIGDERNRELRTRLPKDDKLRVAYDGKVMLVGLRNPIGIYSREDLCTFFQRDLKPCVNGSVPVLAPCNDGSQSSSAILPIGMSENSLKDCYYGIQADIDDLICAGIVCTVEEPTKRSSHGNRIFFPAPDGLPLPPDARELYHSIQLPSMRELQAIKHKKSNGTCSSVKNKRKRPLHHQEGKYD